MDLVLAVEIHQSKSVEFMCEKSHAIMALTIHYQQREKGTIQLIWFCFRTTKMNTKTQQTNKQSTTQFETRTEILCYLVCVYTIYPMCNTCRCIPLYIFLGSLPSTLFPVSLRSIRFLSVTKYSGLFVPNRIGFFLFNSYAINNENIVNFYVCVHCECKKMKRKIRINSNNKQAKKWKNEIEALV